MPTQFLDFYNSLATDSAKRGKQFEHFVKWFLKADPEWATQVDQVWLWDEYPERWGIDCGVDLVCTATAYSLRVHHERFTLISTTASKFNPATLA